MIVVVLLLIAAGCVAAGLTLDEMNFHYAALTTSGLAALILAIAGWRSRHDATTASRTTEAPEPHSDDVTMPSPESTPEPDEATAAPAEHVAPPETANTATPPDVRTTVLVIPGRRRYHQPDCKLVAEADSEEITLAEAVDEGFSACTACTHVDTTAD